jgi:hypothetical protein
MRKPRKALISLDHTAYYHCMCRCVLQTFLCSNDSFTYQSCDLCYTYIALIKEHILTFNGRLPIFKCFPIFLV